MACVNAQDQMVDPTSVVSHVVAIALGGVLHHLIVGGGTNCPACSVVCGSITCPAVSCTTGHIELGHSSLLGLGLILIICLLSSWCWRRAETGWIGAAPSTKGGLVDGRRALGQAIGWRPESR